MSDNNNSPATGDRACLTIDDKVVAYFDVALNSMETEMVICGSKLRTDSQKSFGMPVSFHDPGYSSVSSCSSEITYIKGDGDQGQLFYRGFAIEDIAKQYSFLEISYLLFHGQLPLDDQLQEYSSKINDHLIVDEQLALFLNGYRRDAHPMSILLGVIAALSSLHVDIDVKVAAEREEAAQLLIAKISTITAMIYKYNIGESFIAPRQDLSYTANLINMMFSSSMHTEEPNHVFVRALDCIFSLHADHEQNASTSTVRMVGSTLVNPVAAVTAGIAALWGPSHGGANEACLTMLEEIGDVSHIDEYIMRAKDPEDSFRLMGFGHRVYHNYDPRAKIMRDICHEVLSHTENDDPIFKLALELERIALADEYFIERKLYPNVDFYSGITLRAMGIPIAMFTVFFAVGRMPGWLAQWNEMHSQESLRISRPRQLYSGSVKRNVNL